MIERVLMVSMLAGALQVHARPNIVLLLVDDLGWSDVACYGNTLHETPNVGRLAREGMRFTDAYAACAVCSPTRASIQTGCYPIRYGITDWIAGARKPNTPLKEKFTARMLPDDAVTIADALKAQGYRTAFVGKWHLNDVGHTTGFPEDQGYEINIGGHHKGSPPGGYFPPFKNPKLENRTSDTYLTDRMGDEAIRLIEEFSRDPDTPFYLMLSFYTVHTPIQPKPELQDYYADKIASQGEAAKWTNAKYAGMVHSMDENVGRVLDALDKQNIADETIVVFFSDNGGLNRVTHCYPLNKGKGYYHEGGIRVPMIIRAPGQVKAGSETAHPVISNDLFPTLLDLAGLSLMPEVHRDGLSLRRVIEGERLKRKCLYWHYPHYHGAGETPASAIRMGDYKFIRHYEGNVKELYNLAKDVGETSNLVASMPEKARALEQALDAWLETQEAYIPVPDPDYQSDRRNTEKHRRRRKQQ